MGERKGEITSRMVDRDWPHRVALRADQVTGKNYGITHDFCRKLSLCPRGHGARRDNTDYVVFCFADPAHANLFRGRFGGVLFNPKDRGRGRNWAFWRLA